MSAYSPRMPKTISHEELADLLDESEIVRSVDTGDAITHELQHPQRGVLYVTSSIAASCTLVAA
jgi:hypothetical protein